MTLRDDHISFKADKVFKSMLLKVNRSNFEILPSKRTILPSGMLSVAFLEADSGLFSGSRIAVGTVQSGRIS